LCKDLEKKIQKAQSLWAKVQKQQSYGGSNFKDNFNFLEIGEFWSTYFDVFESPRKGLQATKILWAKAQKQKSYWVIKF